MPLRRGSRTWWEAAQGEIPNRCGSVRGSRVLQLSVMVADNFSKLQGGWHIECADTKTPCSPGCYLPREQPMHDVATPFNLSKHDQPSQANAEQLFRSASSIPKPHPAPSVSSCISSPTAIAYSAPNIAPHDPHLHVTDSAHIHRLESIRRASKLES
jgi:hypothetical protein